jgi:hypothetical protein
MSTFARHNPDQPEKTVDDYDCATEWEASER